MFYRLLFGLLVHPASHTTMSHPLSSYIPSPLNLLLELNMNMKFNPETAGHDDMYNVMCKQPDASYEPMLFESLEQI